MAGSVVDRHEEAQHVLSAVPGMHVAVLDAAPVCIFSLHHAVRPALGLDKGACTK